MTNIITLVESAKLAERSALKKLSCAERQVEQARKNYRDAVNYRRGLEIKNGEEPC